MTVLNVYSITTINILYIVSFRSEAIKFSFYEKCPLPVSKYVKKKCLRSLLVGHVLTTIK